MMLEDKNPSYLTMPQYALGISNILQQCCRPMLAAESELCMLACAECLHVVPTVWHVPIVEISV